MKENVVLILSTVKKKYRIDAMMSVNYCTFLDKQSLFTYLILA